jgi:hypothetical protein
MTVLDAAMTRLDFRLGRERSKSRCGHHLYDLNRHIALLQARKTLRRIMDQAKKGGP